MDPEFPLPRGYDAAALRARLGRLTRVFDLTARAYAPDEQERIATYLESMRFRSEQGIEHDAFARKRLAAEMAAFNQFVQRLRPADAGRSKARACPVRNLGIEILRQGAGATLRAWWRSALQHLRARLHRS